jgi:hypothetical protein
MLGDIQKNGGVEKIGEFIKQVKDKNSNVKLMGFGHRVYKNYDPRAKLMRETCHEVLGATGPGRRPAVQAGDGAGEDRAGRRLLRQPQAVPERRLLLGHRAARHRHPGEPVHRHLRAGAHRGLDRPAQRDDRRPRIQDRPPAPALRLNAAPFREDGARLLPLVDLLVVNRLEAGALLDTASATPEQLAQALRARGPSAVLLSLGADGLVWADEQGLMHLPARRVQAVDTVGAGDTLVGALVTALAEGQGRDAALAFAQAAAALAVSRPGVQDAMPRRAEVEQLLGSP